MDIRRVYIIFTLVAKFSLTLIWTVTHNVIYSSDPHKHKRVLDS